MNRHIESRIVVGEVNRHLLTVPQLVPLLTIVVGGELVLLVPLPEMQHRVQRSYSQRVLGVIHLLEGPLLRRAADHHRAQLIHKLQRRGRVLHILQQLRNEQVNLAGTRGEGCWGVGLLDEERRYRHNAAHNEGLVVQVTRRGQEDDVGQVVSRVCDDAKHDISQRHSAAHAVTNPVQRVCLVEELLVQQAVVRRLDLPLILHLVLAHSRQRRVFPALPLLLLDDIDRLQKRLVIQNHIIDIKSPVLFVLHAQNLMASPPTLIMSVRPAKRPEEHIIPLQIALDRQRQRWFVTDPRQRCVHHTMLQIHHFLRLGSWDAEQDDAVTVGGVNRVLLQRVPQQRLRQHGGSFIGDGVRHAGLVEDGGGTTCLQCAEIVVD